MEIEQQPKQSDLLQMMDRQIHTYGMEAMDKLQHSSVLISGMSGTGVEIAKNVILSGIRHVSIHDPAPVSLADLSSHFYLTPADVGKPRASSCLTKLIELNQFVRCDELTGDLTPDALGQYAVVVLVDPVPAEAMRVSQVCRAKGAKFILANTSGLFARMFSDFGPAHEVTDTTGELCKMCVVTGVSQEPVGVVMTLEEQHHGFETGDWVQFSQVEGMVELNSLPPVQIKVTGPSTFTIGDTSAFHPYEKGGYVQQVKVPVRLSFEPYEVQRLKPTIFEYDFLHIGRGAQLHIGFLALDAFRERHGRLPLPHNIADAEQVVALAREACGAMAPGAAPAPLDEDLLRILARVSAGNLSPMASTVGGVIGQEVMKAVTGKYTPLTQWLYLDSSECLPNPLPAEADAAPVGSRYDGQIAVFGRALNETVRNLSYFVVGAGAIGCELLKTFALMGIGTGPSARLTVTDMDNIEMSNLSRQFLFRPWDVQKMKSLTAAEAIQRINPDVAITARADRVGPETEDIFGDVFFGSLSGVANALDNVQARLYMDSRCLTYRKPLLESGTLGTKGNTQVVVPRLTESYGSSRDPPEKEIPLCTLKNFPHLIEHTIEWARSEFEGRFHQDALEANKYLETRDGAREAIRTRPGDKKAAVALLKDILVTHCPRSLDDCAVWARHLFERCFVNNIKQLLFSFPPGSTGQGGVPFWSGSKKMPTPLVYDPLNEAHADFIEAAALLRAAMFGIHASGWNRDRAAQIAARTPIPPFVPTVDGAPVDTGDKTKELDATAASAMGAGAGSSSADVSFLEDLSWLEEFNALPDPATLRLRPLNPIEFEKDDDANHHIDFITAVSNLRASNYAIPHADRRRTKQIAGRIIPAIATTTSVVAGLISMELYKLHQTPPREIGAYRNWFVNLALPTVQFIEPMPAPKVGEKFTIWDTIDVDLKKDPTLREVLEHLHTTRGWTISSASCGVALLYMSFWPKPKQEMRLSMRVSELFQTVSKQELIPGTTSVVLEVCCEDDAGTEIEVPPIVIRIPPVGK